MAQKSQARELTGRRRRWRIDARAGTQRRAGRALRRRQDDAGRGAARGDRHDPAGRLGDRGHHRQRLRPGRGAPAALGRRCPARRFEHDGDQGQPARHPRLRRLRRRAAGRAARRRRGAVRGLRRRRHRRRDRRALGGVRRGRHAARGRRSPGWTTSAPTSTRRSPRASAVFGDNVLPLYLPLHRRRRRAGRPASSGCSSQQVFDYSGGYPPTSASPTPSTCRPSTDARNALIEGIIAESEDESLMDRYLGGEDIELEMLIDDLEKAVARGSFYPVLAGLRGDRARPGRAAGGARPAPSRRRWSTTLPPVTGVDGSPREPLTLRPGRPAGGRGGQDDHRPVRRAGSRWSGSSPARCGRTSPVHVSGHGLAERGHADHDADERVGAPLLPARRHAARGARTCVAGDIVRDHQV